MDTRILNLLKAFENQGWEKSGTVDISTEWWFKEILLLTSVWRPVGKEFYLALIVDPLSYWKKEVHAVAFSETEPTSCNDFFKTIFLNEINNYSLLKTVKEISKYIRK